MARYNGPYYTVLNMAGDPVAGSPDLDDDLRGLADQIGGAIVEDGTAKIVYPELSNTRAAAAPAEPTSTKENEQ